MRIAILTSGRFHVCDLARELHFLGHDVAFYTLVPPWRTARFGLPWSCHRNLLPFVAPAYAAVRASMGTRFESTANHLLNVAVDEVAARLIGKCDLFIGVSGLSVRSLRAVRRKYGARVFLERGSRHILSQKAILEQMPGSSPDRPPVPSWAVDRELEGYSLADTVVVPSRHVVASFVEQGFSPDKLFRNPYGTQVDLFVPSPLPMGEPTTVTTGAWSYQKGSDVLVEAWRRAGAGRLLHVGPLAGAPVPADPGFTHHDAVDQSRLPQFYAQGHVFALASRQDGLALVQAQALACGLPLVCTDRTGGEDLAELVGDRSLARVVPASDSAAFAQQLKEALAQSSTQSERRELAAAARAALSWRAYGRRYDERLLN